MVQKTILEKILEILKSFIEKENNKHKIWERYV